MSDLIVIGYPDEQTAARAWDELTRLQRDYLVDLEDAAIIRRDQKGRLHITTPAHHAVAWGTLSGLFWGFLIGLIFLFPLGPIVGAGLGVAGGLAGAGIGTAADLAIEDTFKQQVQGLVQPGTSAILVVLRKVTLDKFLEALQPYGGTVLRTSLPHEAEQKLMQALHGPDPSAVTWEQPGESAPTAGLPGAVMTPSQHPGPETGRPTPSPGRLWAGGVATAIVAALVVVAGVFIARRILGIPVLAPKAAGDLGSSVTAVYAGVAAACALLATGLLHVLLLSTPRPLVFFAWITALADLIAVAAPFSQPAALASKVFTAVINLVAGVAVISLLTSVGATTVRPEAATRPEPDSRMQPR